MSDEPANARLEQFATDVEALRPAQRLNGDVLRSRLGAALMALGIAIGAGAYFLSHRTADPFTQGDAIVIAGLGICVSITGSALYLRHGLAHFLRLWLARLIYENAAARNDSSAVPPNQ